MKYMQGVITHIKEDHVTVGISIIGVDSIEPLRELDIAKLLP